jgi:hypothetical protein
MNIVYSASVSITAIILERRVKRKGALPHN